MRKLLKKMIGILGLMVLIQGLLLSQAPHPKTKSILEKPTQDSTGVGKFLQIDESSPAQKGRELSSQLPAGIQESETEKIAKNLVKMVVNPLKGNQEILDAIKAISQYYTEGGSQNFGIKVDI